MRVLGYSFSEPQAARRAQRALTEQYELGPDDARVGELADDGTVLAVRARDENATAVGRLLEQLGGQRLTDVDEAWTLSRSADARRFPD